MPQVIAAATYVVMFKAYLASDHVTEATGKTIAITISKNGGAFGNPNAGATNATEVSSGWYKFSLDATDTATVGPVAWRGAVATIDDAGGIVDVIAQYATPTNITAGTITTATNVTTVNGLAANVITAASIATDAIDNDAIAANAVTEIQSGLGTAANQTTIIGLIDTEVAAILAAVDTEVAAIKAKTDQLVFTTANRVDSQVFGMEAGTVTAAAVATGAIDADALAADAVDEIWDEAVDGSVTARQSLRLANSANGGKASGMATTAAVLRDLADSKDRVQATVDADGNRTAVTLDLT